MTQNITSLGRQEAALLARLASEGRSVFSTAEAASIWRGARPVGAVLHRLARNGWLARLQRGLYLLIPLEAGPERAWTESPLVIAQHLIRPAAVAYWSALSYWQLTEQLPRLTFVQSTRRKQALSVLGMPFQFVTVRPRRFFGLAPGRVSGREFKVTDREKTLLDCADRPGLGGGSLQLAEALRAGAAQIDWPRLDRYLERWGGGAVAKRLGYLAERLALPMPDRQQRLEYWRGLITRGVSLLEPGAGRSGPVVTAWQLRINVPALVPDRRA
jgi:predicted transcriptional regulator of viral defense system